MRSNWIVTMTDGRRRRWWPALSDPVVLSHLIGSDLPDHVPDLGPNSSTLEEMLQGGREGAGPQASVEPQ